MDTMIKVVIKKANESTGIIKLIESGLKSLQDAVQGYIEIPFLSEELNERGIDIIINEEGKLLRLDTNVVIKHKGKICDTLNGDILFASHDDDGNTAGLTQDQIDYIFTNVLNNRQSYLVNGESKILPTLII